MDPSSEIETIYNCSRPIDSMELARFAYKEIKGPTAKQDPNRQEPQRPPWVSRGRGMGRCWTSEDFEQEERTFRARNRDLPPYVVMRDARGDIVPDGTRMIRDGLQEAMLETLSDTETGGMSSSWDSVVAPASR
ncbi:uncharacterized protein PG986_012374 [Apiospora aurea]|uniref:Uncharacterized protein n=1 Tax=Apiospora aurea TaxID=335848 RepID=A0ABR1PZS7_9PEZI